VDARTNSLGRRRVGVDELGDGAIVIGIEVAIVATGGCKVLALEDVHLAAEAHMLEYERWNCTCLLKKAEQTMRSRTWKWKGGRTLSDLNL
jgi:hypothetical protein